MQTPYPQELLPGDQESRSATSLEILDKAAARAAFENWYRELLLKADNMADRAVARDWRLKLEAERTALLDQLAHAAPAEPPNEKRKRPLFTGMFIRWADLAQMVPVSRFTIRRWMAAGKFPKSFQLGEGTTVWDRDAVLAWCKEMKPPTAASSPTEEE